MIECLNAKQQSKLSYEPTKCALKVKVFIKCFMMFLWLNDLMEWIFSKFVVTRDTNHRNSDSSS